MLAVYVVCFLTCFALSSQLPSTYFRGLYGSGNLNTKELWKCIQALRVKLWFTLMLRALLAMPIIFLVSNSVCFPKDILQYRIYFLNVRKIFLYIIEIRCWWGCRAMEILIHRTKWDGQKLKASNSHGSRCSRNNLSTLHKIFSKF